MDVLSARELPGADGTSLAHIYVSDEYINNYIIHKHTIEPSDIDENTHIRHKYAMVLAGFSRDILAEFNNCNYAYFDLGSGCEHPSQADIIERLKLLKPRYKFLHKIRVVPEEL